MHAIAGVQLGAVELLRRTRVRRIAVIGRDHALARDADVEVGRAEVDRLCAGVDDRQRERDVIAASRRMPI